MRFVENYGLGLKASEKLRKKENFLQTFGTFFYCLNDENEVSASERDFWLLTISWVYKTKNEPKKEF